MTIKEILDKETSDKSSDSYHRLIFKLDDLNDERLFYVDHHYIQNLRDGTIAELSVMDLRSTNWVIVKEWYEDIQKYHKNGILCQVSNESDVDTMRNLDIIIEYNGNDDKKFKSLYHEWRYAKPVSQEEAPDILEEIKLC